VPDPTNSQAFNRYMFCLGNPINLQDITGFSGTPNSTGSAGVTTSVAANGTLNFTPQPGAGGAPSGLTPTVSKSAPSTSPSTSMTTSPSTTAQSTTPGATGTQSGSGTMYGEGGPKSTPTSPLVFRNGLVAPLNPCGEITANNDMAMFYTNEYAKVAEAMEERRDIGDRIGKSSSAMAVYATAVSPFASTVGGLEGSLAVGGIAFGLDYIAFNAYCYGGNYSAAKSQTITLANDLFCVAMPLGVAKKGSVYAVSLVGKALRYTKVYNTIRGMKGLPGRPASATMSIKGGDEVMNLYSLPGVFWSAWGTAQESENGN